MLNSETTFVREFKDAGRIRWRYGLSDIPRLAVAVCSVSWRRGLEKTLGSLASQKASHHYEFAHVFLVWNSEWPLTAAEQKRILSWQSSTWPTLALDVHIERRLGIPFARNAALALARRKGVQLLAFIDDDMTASPQWLEELVKARAAENSFAVAGENTILPCGESSPWLPPEKWGVQSYPFHQVSEPGTGDLQTAYTSNVLISLAELDSRNGEELCFDSKWAPEGGEDIAFFRAAHARGLRIHFCSTARTTEIYCGERLNFGWHLKRAFRNGKLRTELSDQYGETRELLLRVLRNYRLRGTGVSFAGESRRRLQRWQEKVGRVLLSFAVICGSASQMWRLRRRFVGLTRLAPTNSPSAKASRLKTGQRG